MISLLKRHKKAVSPVIAVVLLIALTVAATAIIWFVTNNYLNTGTASLLPSDSSSSIANYTNSDTLQVEVKLTASEQIDLSSVSISGPSELTYEQTSFGSTNSSSVTLDQGETVVTMYFSSSSANGIDSGQYNVEYTFAPSGGGSNQVNDFNVNVS